MQKEKVKVNSEDLKKELKDLEKDYKKELQEATEMLNDPEKAEKEKEELLEDIEETKSLGSQIIKMNKTLEDMFKKDASKQKRNKILKERLETRKKANRKKNKAARASRKSK